MSGVFLCAGAVKSAAEHLLHTLPGAPPEIRYGTAGALRDRALAGEAADVIVTSDEALAKLAIAPGSRVPMGAAVTGLAVRDGAPRRPIATEAALREALLAAQNIAWADPARGATGGRHFEKVIRALGIEAEMRAKALIVPFGVEAVAACGRGEVELAVSQATEIIGQPGVALLGAFPPPHALSTTYAGAALRETADARRILDWLRSPAMRAELRRIGFEETTP